MGWPATTSRTSLPIRACAPIAVSKSGRLNYAKKITAAPGLDTKDFGIIQRADETKHTTHKGLPLYYFTKVKKPGDTFGNGLVGVWHVALAK